MHWNNIARTHSWYITFIGYVTVRVMKDEPNKKLAQNRQNLLRYGFMF